jgi:hypothetical protein
MNLRVILKNGADGAAVLKKLIEKLPSETEIIPRGKVIVLYDVARPEEAIAIAEDILDVAFIQ